MNAGRQALNQPLPDYKMLLILGTIIVGGVFGGFVNFYLAKPDDVPTPSKTRSIVIGVAASFLVPLFLNMISSNLIDLIGDGDNTKLLILLGFCLVAAISSTAFIRTLSDRVLSEARQAKKEAQEAKAEVSDVQDAIQPIVAKETEDDPPDSAEIEAETERRELSPEDKILGALSRGRYALRSASGLAQDIGSNRSEVVIVLDELRSRGLVARQDTGRGVRWFITDSGRSTPRGR